jgi:hypothetical protein
VRYSNSLGTGLSRKLTLHGETFANVDSYVVCINWRSWQLNTK